MRILLIVGTVFTLAAAHGDRPARRIQLDPASKVYIFPKAVSDDVRICLEVGPEHLTCVTAKHLRDRYALIERAR